MNVGSNSRPYFIDNNEGAWQLVYIENDRRVDVASEPGGIGHFCLGDKELWMHSSIPGEPNLYGSIGSLFRYNDGQCMEIQSTTPHRISTMLVHYESVYAFGENGIIWKNNYPKMSLSADSYDDQRFSIDLDLELKTADYAGDFEFYIVADAGEVYYSLDATSKWVTGCVPITAECPAGLQCAGILEFPLSRAQSGLNWTFYYAGELLDFGRSELLFGD